MSTRSDCKSQPTIFFIFGATGDLTSRKLIPALHNLFLDDWLPGNFSIVGLGRTALTDEQFRETLRNDINQYSRRGQAEDGKWAAFSQHVTFLVSDIGEASTYERMVEHVKAFAAKTGGTPTVIFYLAVAPRFFGTITDNLANFGLAADESKTRIIIEKPFGHDVASSRELNQLLARRFSENQIYRIDHYLGKETVQNIMAFRFGNSVFEPLWNRNYIEHVQISVSEKLGMGNRGGYYDESGAMRDMIQNHILQLLCLVAMEPPVSFEADKVRDKKVEVLRSMRRFQAEDIKKHTVRGQYTNGWIDGKEVPAYRKEKGVKPDSNTETFAAIKFHVDNWRWHGIPFYLRTGKRMQQSSSIISIQFKDVPHMIFPNEAVESWQQNRLVISIQPEMSIRLQVQAKRPGLDMTLNPVDLVFDYHGTNSKDTPEAYETLLLDTMVGDQTLFMRGDQVEEAWELLQPILNTWEGKKSLNFPNYFPGSWGPETSEALIAQDGFHWFTLPFKEK